MDDGFQSWPYKGWVWPQTGILDLATIMHAQLYMDLCTMAVFLC